MTRDLDGQVVVVTGAAGGLGAALSRLLHARGARLALLGLGTDDLAGVAAELPGSVAWEADVSDGDQMTRVAAEVLERFGRVDVVVANAGIGTSGTLLDLDPETYDRVITVNLLGSVRTVRAFLPALVASRGHVLQVASLAAYVHAPLMSAYAASKAGVEAFANSLRAEVAHRGVTVGVAYLAFTETAMVAAVDSDPVLQRFRASLPGPFGRTYPLAPAAQRIADGLVRRDATVYAQRWLRVMPVLRGYAAPVIVRMQGAQMVEYEAARARGASTAGV